jgi:hypothetical protein
MTTSPIRSGLACLCALALVVAGSPLSALAENEPVGSITGKVFDGDSRTPLPNVVVRAHAITAHQNLAGVSTDERGTFFIPEAPASIYTFTLVEDGVDYPVTQRLDARAGMTFLLDSCLRLDRETRTASVVAGDCTSEFVAEAQVVTIGPHRFLRPQSPGEPLSLFPPEQTSDDEPAVPEAEEASDGAGALQPDPAQPDATEPERVGETEEAPQGLFIEHDELDCLQHDQFPLVISFVRPGPDVETCRVYFRSDKYPDFYWVQANVKPETADDFEAILPKPSAETERIIYYVEAVDKEYRISQTAEADPEVNDEACTRDPAGAYYQGATPDIVVGATTAGAAAVPPGFQALGITGFISAAGVTSAVTAAAAAGGAAAGAAGLSTGLVIVVSGAAVATGGAVVTTVTGSGNDTNEASNP